MADTFRFVRLVLIVFTILQNTPETGSGAPKSTEHLILDTSVHTKFKLNYQIARLTKLPCVQYLLLTGYNITY